MRTPGPSRGSKTRVTSGSRRRPARVKNDILNISASLEAAAGLAVGGDLRGIKWTLRRVPEMISTPSGKGRVRRQKWMLRLTPEAAWAQERFRFARAEHEQAQELASGVDESTGEILDAEFEVEADG